MIKKSITLLLLLAASISVWAQIVSIPIPGTLGLNVTVGVGANATPLTDIRNNPAAVNVTMGDDSFVNVPLGFSFPYFGQSFAQSWMHSNGVVSFKPPSETSGFCCHGQNLSTTINPAYNYAIMPMWTDLIASDDRSHWYLRGPSDLTFGWYGVNEYGTQNRNSFEVKINSLGLVDVRLQGALVTLHSVTSGMTGDLSQGQFFQFYHGNGWNASGFNMQWSTSSSGIQDPCVSNPLYSVSCGGYAVAYMTQQCTVSVLYDPSCPGYQQAYFVQQCMLNPLSSRECPGYQQAYYNQQCSLNALYDSGCPGYQEAYYNQQCSLNPLYDRKCPNFSAAYATQQLLNQQPSPVTSSSTASINEVVVTNNSTMTSAPSASPAAVTTAVPLASSAPPVAGLTTLTTTPASPTPTASASPQPTTRAQQLQQARLEAARKEAASKSKEAQLEAKEAKTMEQQIATQTTVITAIGYNPAFSAYENMSLKDAMFYRSREIYSGKTNVDNRRALWGLYGPSERRFEEMRDQQYK